MLSWFEKNGDGTSKSKRSYLLLGLAVVAGVLLLLLGNGFQRKETEPESTVWKPHEDELMIYQEYLEERVKVICQSVRGVDAVTVIVSLEGGFCEEYATELHDGDERYVILGNGSSAKALFLSRQAPSIAGIGVVCRGASDPSVQEELISLLSATFRVPSNRIHITQAK